MDIRRGKEEWSPHKWQSDDGNIHEFLLHFQSSNYPKLLNSDGYYILELIFQILLTKMKILRWPVWPFESLGTSLHRTVLTLSFPSSLHNGKLHFLSFSSLLLLSWFSLSPSLMTGPNRLCECSLVRALSPPPPPASPYSVPLSYSAAIAASENSNLTPALLPETPQGFPHHDTHRGV